MATKKCKNCYKTKVHDEFAISDRINKHEENEDLRHRVNVCKSCQLAQVAKRKKNELAPLMDGWGR